MKWRFDHCSSNTNYLCFKAISGIQTRSLYVSSSTKATGLNPVDGLNIYWGINLLFCLKLQQKKNTKKIQKL